MSDETLTLQITHSVTVFGPDVHYNFPHLSIQEFIAALHIQWMRDEDREASAIQGLMDNDPLNPVITFYAGLTKLKNKKVQDILMEVQKIKHSIVRTMMYTGISIDTRQKQMALLNSIYECQDTDLVKIYTPNVTKDRIPNPWSVFLNISLLPLYPSDCLSLAYYARKKESKLAIILRLCSITDVGLETFSNELSKGIDEVTLGNITLTLIDNLIITDRANRSITTLLSSGKISHFHLRSCTLPDTVSTTLKCIINGLNKNSSLHVKELTLVNSNINITHVHYLILLVLKNSNLCGLNLSGNDLNKAIPLLSSALIHSKIEWLSLNFCRIDDDGLYCLFEALRHNIKLSSIDIDNNPKITTLGLKKGLSMLLEEEYSHPTLYTLSLSTNLEINFIRRIRYRDVPPLCVCEGQFSYFLTNFLNVHCKLIE